VIIPTIGLDHSEIELYKKVAAKGYRIYFQTVPGTKRVWWEDAVKKLKD
jgi:mannose/fructose/N-acetylgalactosamine-specific phosphotransferase system component IIB